MVRVVVDIELSSLVRTLRSRLRQAGVGTTGAVVPPLLWAMVGGVVPPPPFVIATQKYQINTVPTPTLA